jgi:signal transduction histidine kinase/CheY-like chemotaxis protein
VKAKLLAIWNHSIRDQLVIGIGLILTLLVTLFTYSITQQNGAFLHEQSIKQAKNRAMMLSTTSRVWVMANDYEGLEQTVQDFLIYENLTYAAVMDMQGKVIAHTDPTQVGRYVIDATRQNFLRRLQGEQNHQHAVTILADTDDYIDVAYIIEQEHQDLGWVNIRIDQKDRQANAAANIEQAVLFSVIALFIAYLTSFLTAKGLTAQLHGLINTMSQIRAGAQKVRANENGVGEVSRLSGEFNRMLDTLQEKESELKQTQHALKEDIRKRQEVENNIRHLNENLEEIVKQRTEELTVAKDKAEAANRAKSLFLANMSHELRTPLNAILGFSQLLYENSDTPDSQRDTLRIINRSGEHLLNLINDVLDMSKIEAGRAQLDKEDFDLGQLILDVTDMMKVRADDKGITLLIDQSSHFPRFVHGDSAKLRQILINLIGNAIKFTDVGGVTLRLDAQQQPQDNQCLMLRIEVEDSGSGIQAEDLERIFQPFEQLANATAQKGTGLGLTITRQFVHMMNGEIHAQSTPGKGSLFYLTIELERATGTQIAKEQPVHRHVVKLLPGQPAWRVLIVEDQTENQLLLQNILTNAGFEVDIAENGQKALALFQSWHPHFIWMDRRMPVMDGLVATREIRKLPGGKDVKIAALTASVFQEQRQELLDAGADDFLRKPYRPNEIFACMAKHLDLQYQYDDEPAAPVANDQLTLEAEAMQHIAPALRQQLHLNAKLGNPKEIMDTIRTIAQTDAKLAQILERLTDEYRFDLIANLSADTAELNGKNA